MERYFPVGTEIQYGNVKTIWEMDGGDGCITMWIYLMPLKCTFKMVKMVNFIYIYVISQFVKMSAMYKIYVLNHDPS